MLTSTRPRPRPRPRPRARARTLTAPLILVPPLLLVAAEVLSPIDTSGDSVGDRVATILEDSDRSGITVLCLLAGLLLLVATVHTLRTLLPGTRQRLASVGTVMAAAGFMLFAVASGALGVGPTAWADSPDFPGRHAAATAFFQAMDDGGGILPVILTGIMLSIPGLALLAIALRRGCRYPAWAAVALPLGWTLFLMGPGHVARAAGALVLAAGLVPAAASRRLDSDELAEPGFRA